MKGEADSFRLDIAVENQNTYLFLKQFEKGYPAYNFPFFKCFILLEIYVFNFPFP
jgi:hypothetical protein